MGYERIVYKGSGLVFSCPLRRKPVTRLAELRSGLDSSRELGAAVLVQSPSSRRVLEQ